MQGGTLTLQVGPWLIALLYIPSSCSSEFENRTVPVVLLGRGPDSTCCIMLKGFMWLECVAPMIGHVISMQYLKLNWPTLPGFVLHGWSMHPLVALFNTVRQHWSFQYHMYIPNRCDPIKFAPNVQPYKKNIVIYMNVPTWWKSNVPTKSLSNNSMFLLHSP